MHFPCMDHWFSLVSKKFKDIEYPIYPVVGHTSKSVPALGACSQHIFLDTGRIEKEMRVDLQKIIRLGSPWLGLPGSNPG